MLISNVELKEKLNCGQDAKLIRWLEERRIKWDKDTKGRPFTTLSAIEQYLFKTAGNKVDFDGPDRADQKPRPRVRRLPE